MSWKTPLKSVLKNINASFMDLDDEHILIRRVGPNGYSVDCLIKKPIEFGGLNILSVFAIATCYKDLTSVPPQVARDVLWFNDESVPIGHWGVREDTDGTLLSYTIKLIWDENETPPDENLIQMALTGCTLFVSEFREDYGVEL